MRELRVKPLHPSISGECEGHHDTVHTGLIELTIGTHGIALCSECWEHLFVLVSKHNNALKGNVVADVNMSGYSVTHDNYPAGPYGLWSDEQQKWLVDGVGRIISYDNPSVAQAHLHNKHDHDWRVTSIPLWTKYNIS